MDGKVAKELLHIREWLMRAQTIVDAGREAYDDDPLLQEAGDSLMVKLGEAATRLSRGGYVPPGGVDWSEAIANRNWIIHQYDQVDRDITWTTLSRDLPEWRSSLAPVIAEAERSLGGGAGGSPSVAERPHRDPGRATLRLDQLHEHAVRAPGMDERDGSVRTRPRCPVDQLDAGIGQLRERGRDIGHLEADVVEPLPP